MSLCLACRRRDRVLRGGRSVAAALIVFACLVPIPTRVAATAPDSLRAALPDSAVLLPWRGGEPATDDPYLPDLNELIRRGQVVTVTPTDTIPVPVAVADTVVATAARVRVSDVVRRIGERMRDDWSALAGATWTELLETEAVDHPGDPDREKRTVEAVLSRVTVADDGAQRRVQLWRRKRVYAGGRLVSEQADSSLSARYPWTERTVGATMDAPFDLLTGDRYRYRILERTLIGDHLIYRIGFEPRSRFQAGLRGQVWIDYGEFAIRRMEGSITGVSPAPLFVKEVPRFRMRQQEVAGHWLPADFSAEVVMRSLPLLPDRFRFRMTYRDFVLPGAASGEVRP